MIDFSKNNQRFVFQSSFDKIEVIPVLHRNSIYFMGMDERENYLCTKLQGDRFIALDKHSVLTTWNIFTGKVIDSFDSGLDLSGFEIYSHNPETDRVYHREWYPKVLLMRRQGKQGANLYLQNRKMVKYDEWIAKENAHFKLVEIENSY